MMTYSYVTPLLLTISVSPGRSEYWMIQVKNELSSTHSIVIKTFIRHFIRLLEVIIPKAKLGVQFVSVTAGIL